MSHSSGLRLSTVILPDRRWQDGGLQRWQRAEELGFHAAYTYDHLSWRPPFRDGPWFGAVPTLTAAAVTTERIRLGTMVTSPNFRHPVPLAKDLLSLDDISGGRLTVGIGAGTASGADATVLGDAPRSPGVRARRFAEMVEMLDVLLTQDETTYRGEFWAAESARMLPGCVQRPRIPLAVAATGPRGMAVAARYGQAWVTTGEPTLERQLTGLDAACREAGRDPDSLARVLLTGFTAEGNGILASVDAFVDFAGRQRQLGFDELVVHWPEAGTVFEADQATFERIATDALSQLG